MNTNNFILKYAETIREDVKSIDPETVTGFDCHYDSSFHKEDIELEYDLKNNSTLIIQCSGSVYFEREKTTASIIVYSASIFDEDGYETKISNQQLSELNNNLYKTI